MPFPVRAAIDGSEPSALRAVPAERALHKTDFVLFVANVFAHLEPLRLRPLELLLLRDAEGVEDDVRDLDERLKRDVVEIKPHLDEEFDIGMDADRIRPESMQEVVDERLCQLEVLPRDLTEGVGDVVDSGDAIGIGETTSGPRLIGID